VEELDVQPVRVEAGELRDAVPLLEAQNELLADVVVGVELVRAVAFTQLQLPLLPRSGSVLERRRQDRERLVDLDLRPLGGPLGGRRARIHSHRRYESWVPA
jgi:hypothetical protein